MTEEEATADGAATREALDADLRRFYGPLDPAQPMTVIHFALSAPPSSTGDQAALWS